MVGSRGLTWGRIGLLVVSILVAILVAELLARAVSDTRVEGDPTSESAERPAGTGTDDLSDRVSDFRISPLLGFQRVPRRPLRTQFKRSFLNALGAPGDDTSWEDVSTNNLGFFSPVDYPYRAASDEYVVGVFGGSVAQWFVLQMGSRLESWLEARPAARGRRVVVLNLAAGAYKQPQQLNLLANLLAQGQRFDLVVNLDGFNEVGLAKTNVRKGVPVALPSASRMVSLAALASSRVDRAHLIELARAGELHDREERLLEMRNECRLALCTAWRDAQIGLVRSALLEATESQSVPAEGHSLLEIGRVPRKTSLQFLPEAVGLWVESSKLMHALLSEYSVPYLHVLQPNQYVGGHRLTARERQTAFSRAMDLRDAVVAGYPLMIERSRELRGAGVAFASAVDIFDREERTIYVDVCCHFNRRGNALLLDFLEQELDRLLPESGEPAADKSEQRGAESSGAGATESSGSLNRQ